MLTTGSRPPIVRAAGSRMAAARDAHLMEHYRVECELAARLRTAPKQVRRGLYSKVYDELYRRIPDHPQLRIKISPEESARRIAQQMSLLRRFLRPETTFLEVGPGDCAFAFEVARHVRRVHGVDVSDEITRSDRAPANFSLSLSDGTSIPVPAGSIDLAYSNQLMEHLHPEDALEQLQNVFVALAAGGLYVCLTPNRLSGPHDVSKHFDRRARGLHLKEYAAYELVRLFERVGFRHLRLAVGGKGRFWLVPAWAVTPLERALELLPFSVRRRLARRLGALLGVRIVARRPAP